MAQAPVPMTLAQLLQGAQPVPTQGSSPPSSPAYSVPPGNSPLFIPASANRGVEAEAPPNYGLNIAATIAAQNAAIENAGVPGATLQGQPQPQQPPDPGLAAAVQKIENDMAANQYMQRMGVDPNRPGVFGKNEGWSVNDIPGYQAVLTSGHPQQDADALRDAQVAYEALPRMSPYREMAMVNGKPVPTGAIRRKMGDSFNDRAADVEMRPDGTVTPELSAAGNEAAAVLRDVYGVPLHILHSMGLVSDKTEQANADTAAQEHQAASRDGIIGQVAGGLAAAAPAALAAGAVMPEGAAALAAGAAAGMGLPAAGAAANASTEAGETPGETLRNSAVSGLLNTGIGAITGGTGGAALNKMLKLLPAPAQARLDKYLFGTAADRAKYLTTQRGVLDAQRAAAAGPTDAMIAPDIAQGMSEGEARAAAQARLDTDVTKATTAFDTLNKNLPGGISGRALRSAMGTNIIGGAIALPAADAAASTIEHAMDPNVFSGPTLQQAMMDAGMGGVFGAMHGHTGVPARERPAGPPDLNLPETPTPSPVGGPPAAPPGLAEAMAGDTSAAPSPSTFADLLTRNQQAVNGVPTLDDIMGAARDEARSPSPVTTPEPAPEPSAGPAPASTTVADLMRQTEGMGDRSPFASDEAPPAPANLNDVAGTGNDNVAPEPSVLSPEDAARMRQWLDTNYQGMADTIKSDRPPAAPANDAGTGARVATPEEVNALRSQGPTRTFEGSPELRASNDDLTSDQYRIAHPEDEDYRLQEAANHIASSVEDHNLLPTAHRLVKEVRDLTDAIKDAQAGKYDRVPEWVRSQHIPKDEWMETLAHKTRLAKAVVARVEREGLTAPKVPTEDTTPKTFSDLTGERPSMPKAAEYKPTLPPAVVNSLMAPVRRAPIKSIKSMRGTPLKNLDKLADRYPVASHRVQVMLTHAGFPEDMVNGSRPLGKATNAEVQRLVNSKNPDVKYVADVEMAHRALAAHDPHMVTPFMGDMIEDMTNLNELELTTLASKRDGDAFDTIMSAAASRELYRRERLRAEGRSVDEPREQVIRNCVDGE